MASNTFRGGSGDNGQALDSTNLNSLSGHGYPEELALPLSNWLLLTGAGLGVSAGATPYRAPYNTSGLIQEIRWRYDSTTTDKIVYNITLPHQYNARTDFLHLLVPFRKIIASDANADLAMICTAELLQPGLIDPTIADTAVPSGTTIPRAAASAVVALTATAKRTLSGTAAAAGTPGYEMYSFDLSMASAARLTAAKALKPGSMLALTLSPHEVVDGGNTMLVGMGAPLLRIGRSASLYDKQSRFNPARIANPTA